MAERKEIYYWKCDRPNAFFAIDDKNKRNSDNVIIEVQNLLKSYFNSDCFTIFPGCGQGNHLTLITEINKIKYFIRIENGDDEDEYMEVEAAIISKVIEFGIPSPHIFEVDSSRKEYSFSYQIIECFDYPDLNKIYKKKELDVLPIMETIGKFIAQWQHLTPEGFGPFNIDKLRKSNELEGLHTRYIDYYRLNLTKHLKFLEENKFIDQEKSDEILNVIQEHEESLKIVSGCLVHKDIALWNLIGTRNQIKAVIDWDDAISGDPTDDISLMACFHSAEEIKSIIDGYEQIRPLPLDFLKRFWLHLLRNMIFKAVIRIGAGYFVKDNNFFLINTNKSGVNDLQEFTLSRINLAIEGLNGYKTLNDL